ncbi:MAG: hypothetical protein AAFR83_00350 [Cyanobacteria bacterium J06629_18]
MRTSKSFRFDQRVIDAILEQSKMSGKTPSIWLESYLVDEFKKLGILPSDFEELGETRGGYRGTKDDWNGSSRNKETN